VWRRVLMLNECELRYGVFLSRAANERDEQLAGGFHRRSGC
jgi:hypothetical protein